MSGSFTWHLSKIFCFLPLRTQRIQPENTDRFCSRINNYVEANDGAIENMRETWLQLSALDLLNLDTFNVFTDEPNVSVPEISKIGRLLGKCVNGKIEKMDVIWNDVLKDGSDEILPIDFVYKKHLGEPLNLVYELLRRSVDADFIERYVKETDRKTWGHLLDLVSSDKSINTQDKDHIASMLAEVNVLLR